jgi:hypothetical protein
MLLGNAPAKYAAEELAIALYLKEHPYSKSADIRRDLNIAPKAWTAITKKGPAWLSNNGHRAGRTWLLDANFEHNYFPVIEQKNE